MSRNYREGWLFLRKWLKEPIKIAAPWPSSRHLARVMSLSIDHNDSGVIVELGGGTGAVTRALLNRFSGKQRLYIIEKDRVLARMLAEKYPEATIIEGDASDLGNLLRARGITRIVAVISSLPMLLIPEQKQFEILRNSFALLNDDGFFVQYTYSRRSPIASGVLKGLGISGEKTHAVWRNLPPARVWLFRQSESASPRHCLIPAPLKSFPTPE